MYKGLFLRLILCMTCFGFCLYSYIDKQNALTQLRFQIPTLSKELKVITEENTRLQYEIDQFENPMHLMELARNSEFSHLKHPLVKEILTVKEAVAVEIQSDEQEEIILLKPPLTLAVVKK